MPDGFKIASGYVTVEPDADGFDEKLAALLAGAGQKVKIPTEFERPSKDPLTKWKPDPVKIPTTATDPFDAAWRAKVNAEIKATAKDAIEIPMDPDTAEFRTKIAGALAEADQMARKPIPVGVDADSWRSTIEEALARTRAEVDAELDADPVKIPTSADDPINDAFMAKLQSSIKSIASDTLKIPATPDMAVFRAKVDAALSAMSATTRQDISLEPDADLFRAKVLADVEAVSKDVKAKIKVEPDTSDLQKAGEDGGGVMATALALGVTAGAPIVEAAIVGGVAAGFIGAAIAAQKGNAGVVQSFGNLKDQVVDEMKSASDQVAPYLANSGKELQQEFAGLGPQLHSVFGEAGPDIQILTAGVEAFASNAMPGMVTAMHDSYPVMSGMATLMSDVGKTTTTVMDGAAKSSGEFGRDLGQVGGLVENLGSVTASVLPGLAHGFGGTVGSINMVLDAVKPIAPALGDMAGQALPVVGMFKLFGLAATPIDNVGAKLQSTGAKMAAMGGASEKVGNTLSSAGKAASGLGAALPLLGAAVGVTSDLIAQNDEHVQQWQSDLLSGGAAAKTAVGQFEQSADAMFDGDGKLLVGLDTQQKALAIYNLMVIKYGAGSSQAAEAQRDLASATAQQAAQQAAQNKAMETSDQLLTDHVNALLDDANASLSLQSATNSVTDAQTSYAAAVKKSGANSEAAKEASVALQQAIMSEISAAGAKAAADDKGGTAAQKAADQTRGQTDAVFGLVESYARSGEAIPPVLGNIASSLDRTRESAAIATGQVEGVTSALDRVPPGKSVTVAALTAEAVSDLEALGYKVVHLPNGKFKITAQDDATSTINRIVASNNGRRITLFVDTQSGSERVAGSPVRLSAHGNLFQPNAIGNLDNLPSMPGGVATVVPPNTPRVIGDNMTTPEAYIPIDPNSQRSQAILAATNQAMGQGGATHNTFNITTTDPMLAAQQLMAQQQWIAMSQRAA